MHASGKSTPEVIFTILHAGGKFSDAAYKTSGGLHGVGSSVTNALSEFLDVTIYRDKKIHNIRFENGGNLVKPLTEEGSTSKRGTTVTFKPDANIFSTTEFNYTTIATRLKEKAYLMKGLKMTLVDKILKKEETFEFKNGLLDYLKELNVNDRGVHKGLLFSGESLEIEVDFAFQYTDTDHVKIMSFVNNVRTQDGGTHETGFKNAFTKTFNEFVTKHKLNKKTFTGDDIREGLTAIISIKVPEKLLEFEGQTKSKLGTAKARNSVENVLSSKLESYLEQNRDVATKLVSKMVDAQKAREAAKKARADAKKTKKKLKEEKILSGKLTPAQSKDYAKNELYLVEGDSAGGSAKQGRDRKHQAILPLRGKVVNTERIRLIDALKNEEIGTIVNTIGAGIGKEFETEDSKYGKIIIMTDADTDGAHIQVLLLTFFYRFMRPLIEAGMVYIALPPLYKVSKAKNIEYA
jgi:topoisomerase-4 subunit B